MTWVIANTKTRSHSSSIGLVRRSVSVTAGSIEVVRRVLVIVALAALVAGCGGGGAGGARDAGAGRQGVSLGPWGYAADPHDVGLDRGWARRAPKTVPVAVPGRPPDQVAIADHAALPRRDASA